jgi:hypothetical protein
MRRVQAGTHGFQCKKFVKISKNIEFARIWDCYFAALLGVGKAPWTKENETVDKPRKLG